MQRLALLTRAITGKGVTKTIPGIDLHQSARPTAQAKTTAGVSFPRVFGSVAQGRTNPGVTLPGVFGPATSHQTFRPIGTKQLSRHFSTESKQKTGPKRKPKIFVTRRLPGTAWLEELNKHFEVTVNPHDRVLTKDELKEALKDKDQVICLLTDPLDEEVINSAPRLKAISTYNVGFNNIDIKAATRRGIPVSYMEDISASDVAELAWGLILGVARRVIETDRITRAGLYKGWTPHLYLGTKLAGKTILIDGMGSIGKETAKRAIAFGMKVIYTARSDKQLPEIPGAKRVSLEEGLKTADIISLHTPLSEHTRHRICEKQLAMMKPTAILINTSRGALINEKALVGALKGKKIAGAGLDVYEREPEIDKELPDLINVVLTPHTGSSTLETRESMSALSAQHAITFHLSGKPPMIANPDVFLSKTSKVATEVESLSLTMSR